MKTLLTYLKTSVPVIAALLIMLCQGTLLKAQEYPVQVTTILTPPYSLYLSDYASAENNTLQLIIQLRELDRPEYRVKLRVTIEGQGITIRTKPSYIPRALVLQGGVPEVLTGPDLSSYLNPDNLDFSGISKQEFIKKGTFPEGFYTFRFEVVDYVRNVVVSNPSLANAWIILNDPPIINLPFNGDKVIASDPQNIMFSWTPRHAASPNAAFNTEYEFTLVELYPANRNPNDAIRAANSIFVMQTSSTSLNYSIMEPMLIPGRKYAFRVRAYDVSKRDLFKNNGYSDVHVFQFGDACVPPLGVKADALDESRIKLMWDQQDIHTGYGIKYRKKGNSSWEEQSVFSNSVIIPGLQGGTTYEYQVKGVCSTIHGNFSALATIETPEVAPEQFSCGAPGAPIELNTTPLDVDLNVDDVIKTSDFEVVITEVTANADGSYKGLGRALIPWFKFASARVKFSSIKVNQEYRVFSGNVTTIYNPNSAFVAKMDLSKDEKAQEQGDATGPSGLDVPENVVDTTFAGDITKIEIDATTGAILITDASGAVTTMPRTKDNTTDNPDDYKETRITDSKGDTYIVDRNGNVLQGPSTAAPGVITDRDSANFTVTFVTNESQENGFDKKSEPVLGTYDKATIQGVDYFIPWKAVELGGQDVINAQAVGQNSFPASVGFKSLTGPIPAQASANADRKQLFVTGKAPDDTEVVSAYVLVQEPGQQTPQEIEVGKINVKTYSKITQKLFVVPVNDATVPSQSTMLTEINKIYGQAVAGWDITVADKFTIDAENIRGLDAEESGMLASYNQKMRQFNRAYKNDASDFDDDAYYIFLIKGSGSARSGIMPFKKQFGYVFTDNTSDVITTIAHEIGHGAFNLRHTFSEFPGVSQRATDNLMDYKGGKELRKYQWDNVHDPEAMIGWLQDDVESAAMGLMVAINENFSPISGEFFMGLTPNGKIIDDVISVAANEAIVPTISNTNPYVIVGFSVYTEQQLSRSYTWSPSTLGYYNGKDPLTITLREAKSFVKIYQLSGNNCTYKLQVIEWDPTVLSADVTNKVKEKIVEANWAINTLYNPDPSCLVTFVKEIIRRDNDNTICNNERIQKETGELLAIVNAAQIDEMTLVYKINSVCKSSIKSLSYDQLEKLFSKLASAEEIQEVKEVAILRLASSINTPDYSKFYALLGKNSNAILRNMVAKMHDRSIYPWDGDNYTNFIGGLCWMFQHYNGVENIVAEGTPNLLGQIVSLRPYKFKATHWASTYTGNKRFNASYNSGTGEITVFQEQGQMVSGPGGNAGEGWGKLGDDFPPIGPLSPIIIVVTDNELELVETALASAANINQNYYIVPAIFLEYRRGKEQVDAIEKTTMITFDIVTIFASGGTALATKVTWARRLWAITEVAGAIGNIGVNTGAIKRGDKLYAAVEYYNLAMLVIGVKHVVGAAPDVAKGIYNFAKALPGETKALLQKNQALKSLLVAQYIKWRTAITSLDNLTGAEKQLVNEGRISEVRSINAEHLTELESQEAVWKALGVTDEVVETGGTWARFTRVSGLNAAALTKIENWAETLVQRLDDALGNFPNLASELNANASLIDEFKTFSTWEGRYASKIKFLDRRISNAPEFERMVDAAIPRLKNGNQPQNIQDLGRVFDQDYVNEAQRAFDNGDFTNLSHLEQYSRDGYQLVTGQVRIKTGVTIGTAVEVRPDAMLFQLNASTGQVSRPTAIWNECKIRPTSPPTPGQSTVFELLGNGTITRNQMEFEVLTSSPALNSIGLPRGSLIGIERINQISVGQNGVLTVISIY